MLREVTVPPGEAGLAVVWPAVESLLTGDAPPLAFVPPADGTKHTESVRTALALGSGGAELDGIAAVVATSGSTGHPRGVLLGLDALTALTHGPDYSWIVALPMTSIGGLAVVVRAALHGRQPSALTSIGGAGPFDPEEVAAVIRAVRAPAPAISLVPLQLERCLVNPKARAALRECARILVGGARLHDHLREQCIAAGITVTSTYGATETAGGCVWDGRPLPGVTITIDDSGRILLDGPMLAAGYRADPAATAWAFTAQGFRTDDIGEIDATGKLTVVGRADDVVIINGVNVSVPAVEDAICAIPGVEACAVTIRGADTSNPQLVGWIVGADPSPNEIRASVAAALGKPAAPREYHLVNELPILPNGKIDRRMLEHDGNNR
jgi:O-succinylbenzoic acid--CoA ligase